MYTKISYLHEWWSLVSKQEDLIESKFYSGPPKLKSIYLIVVMREFIFIESLCEQNSLFLNIEKKDCFIKIILICTHTALLFTEKF